MPQNQLALEDLTSLQERLDTECKNYDPQNLLSKMNEADKSNRTDSDNENNRINEIGYLKEKIEILRNKNETIELTVRKQIDAFMNFMQEEKIKD